MVPTRSRPPLGPPRITLSNHNILDITTHICSPRHPEDPVMNLVEELFHYVRVTMTPTGFCAIEMPSSRDVAQCWRLLRIQRPPPDDTSPFWAEFAEYCRPRIPLLVEHAKRRSARPLPTPRPQEDPPAQRSSSPSADEARIKSLPSAELYVILAALNIPVERHPTNPGISSMRARNALYTHIRRGGTLSARPASRWVVTEDP
jgi:hypothetical protein